MENLLLGFPDEFIDLSFRDFAFLQKGHGGAGDEKKAIAKEPILEDGGGEAEDQAVGEWSTSVDLGRGFHEYYSKQQQQQPPILCLQDELWLNNPPASHDAGGTQRVKPTPPLPPGEKEPGGRNKMRSGIPHSNLCAICHTSTWIFWHRCLVCGRAYCMHCVKLGMGEMSQGRKCVECLGSKFSERYMARAGKVGCFFGYTRRRIRQQELIWAKKGLSSSSFGKKSGSSGEEEELVATAAAATTGFWRRLITAGVGVDAAAGEGEDLGGEHSLQLQGLHGLSSRSQCR